MNSPETQQLFLAIGQGKCCIEPLKQTGGGRGRGNRV